MISTVTTNQDSYVNHLLLWPSITARWSGVFPEVKKKYTKDLNILQTRSTYMYMLELQCRYNYPHAISSYIMTYNHTGYNIHSPCLSWAFGFSLMARSSFTRLSSAWKTARCSSWHGLARTSPFIAPPPTPTSSTALGLSEDEAACSSLSRPVPGLSVDVLPLWLYLEAIFGFADGSADSRNKTWRCLWSLLPRH